MSDVARAYSADGWLAKSSGAVPEAPVVYPRVTIEYCSGCGYAPRYEEAAAYIEKEFRGKVEVEGVVDQNGDGRFEISVNGVNVHSKLSRDEGFLDSQSKRENVFSAIREACGKSASIVEASSTDIEAVAAPQSDLETTPKKSNTSLIFSLITLVLSIPALIGACCWPALLVGLISGTVSSAARTLGHWVSFGLTAVLMLTVNIFMIRGLKHRYVPEGNGKGCLGRRCQYYGPLILTMIAAPLIMADLCRHVLGDLNVWPWCGDPSAQGGVVGRVNESWTSDCFWSSTEYRCSIPCCVPGNNSVASTNNLNFNYLLVDGVNKPYETLSCTCNPSKYPTEFVEECKDYYGKYNETLAISPSSNCVGGNGAYTGPALKAVVGSGGHVQSFVEDDSAPAFEMFLPPFWPEYRELNQKELDVVHEEAVKGNPDMDPQDIPECNCLNCVPAEDENIHNLSFIGVLFTICFTYLGFTFLAVGTLWNADILKKLGKIKAQWNEIQAQRRIEAKRSASQSHSLQEPLL